MRGKVRGRAAALLAASAAWLLFCPPLSSEGAPAPNPAADELFSLPEPLGKARLEPAVIQALAESRDPALVRELVATLPDLLEYLRVARFGSYNGDIRIRQNDMTWHINKPGWLAIRKNEGNCGASANALVYTLEGDYDEVGYVYFQEDGGGHVFNYIKQESRYYLIDLVQYGFQVPALFSRRVRQYAVLSFDDLIHYANVCKSSYGLGESIIYADLGGRFGHSPAGDGVRTVFGPQDESFVLISATGGWTYRRVTPNFSGPRF